jgi:hypothetical protein
MNPFTKHPNPSTENVRVHLRVAEPGVAPAEMIGKVLKSIRVSHMHPTVTLHFKDQTSFQICVRGYDPTHPGMPRTIETSPELEPLLASEGALNYTVINATVITMMDHAFQFGKRESAWQQRHARVAFKFQE